MPIIPPGYAEVILPFSHSALARPALVTYGVAISDVPNLSGVNAHVAAWESAWNLRLANEVTVGPATMRVGQDGGENLVLVGTQTETGANASEVIAPNTALLVRKVTARGGRRGRGRCFLPWVLTESVVNENGRIPGANLADFQTSCNDWLTAINAIGIVDAMVVLHNEGDSTPGLPNVVTSLVADGVVGSQRRRLGR